MTEAKLTIGHIARSAGVNIETVRYYQRRGLVNLPPSERADFDTTRPRLPTECASSNGRRPLAFHLRKYSVF
jgi:hypothetical protein